MGMGIAGPVRGPEQPASRPTAPGQPTDTDLLRRFARQRDEAAFAVLVRRHGPTVLAASRRVLKDSHEAEEVFQATFLTLVRKARAVARPELLGNWLYGVATKLALKARARAARRHVLSPAAARELPAAPPPAGPDHQEVLSILDEEVVRLPEKYRAPLVLCYLQGLTNEDAARRLGWPPGSMSYRLARGRELLRERLNRRGVRIAPLALLGLLGGVGSASAAPVPDALVDQAVRAARAATPADTPPPGPGRKLAPAVAVVLVLFLIGASVAGVRPWSAHAARPTPAAVPGPATPDADQCGPKSCSH